MYDVPRCIMIDPIAFSILGRPIYWYGIMVALGFLGAVWHWNHLARRQGLPEGLGSDLGLIVIVGGILGARVAYILSNLDHYLAHPLEMLRIDQGGLIFYGGFILATLAVIVFARVRGLPLLRVGDFTVSALPLGHAMGRIGCFLNGCCYGAPTDVPWATYVADAMRHPVQLYEASFNFILYAVLHLLLRTARTGQVVAVYLMSYGTWRFLIEFLRGDDRLRTGGLDAAQLISLGLILIGAGLALGLRRTPRTG